MAKLYQPTEEMYVGIDHFVDGSDLAIEAGAGTGKTTTLRHLALARRRSRGKYIVYNAAMKQYASEIFPKKVTCSTSHGLAWGPVGQFYDHRLKAPRMPAREVAKILGITENIIVKGEGDHFIQLRPKAIARLVMSAAAHRFPQSAHDEVQPWMIEAPPGCNTIEAKQAIREQLLPIAQRVWSEDLCLKTGRLPFNHDCYLKIWAMTKPILKGCDYILLDEAQDANPVMVQIFDLQTQAQRVLVGDRCQAIYGWRGAVDAMKKFEREGVATCRLTQSFRFGTAIAHEANKFLSLLRSPLRLRGYSEIESEIAAVEHADAVLCRSNAGTVIQALHELTMGRSVALVGGAGQIRELAHAAMDLKEGKGTDHRELLAFTTWDEVREYAELDEAGKDIKVFVGLIDKHGPELLITLCERLVEEDQADVVISTAHRAKGREWSRVRVSDDFHPPLNGSGSDDETRLAYVTVTRAKHILDRGSLFWIDDL